MYRFENYALVISDSFRPIKMLKRWTRLQLSIIHSSIVFAFVRLVFYYQMLHFETMSQHILVKIAIKRDVWKFNDLCILDHLWNDCSFCFHKMTVSKCNCVQFLVVLGCKVFWTLKTWFPPKRCIGYRFNLHRS